MNSEIPNIITYTKAINPSLFMYYNLFLIDTLNNDNLYPINIKTKVLDTVEKRQSFISNIILNLFASLISICNYAYNNDKKYDISLDILNKYNDNYILKSYTLTSTFRDNIKPHNVFMNDLKKKCNLIYKDNNFVNSDFSLPINVIKENINTLKELNEGFVDEVNLSNFIVSMYKNIVDISYYLFTKEKDNALICQKFLSRHNELMKELSTDYVFFGSNLEMFDMLRKNYTKIEDFKYDELNNRIMSLLDDKLIPLLDSLPSNYNNFDLKTDYNNKINENINSIKLQLEEKKIDYFMIYNLINDTFSILDTILNITYANTNLITIQLKYKSSYQYLLELYDMVTLISEKNKEKKVNDKVVEGFSKKCNCFLSKFVLFLLLLFLIYMIIKKFKSPPKQ